jgi:crotonobetainyl-CoA:carnitine CoA-transferase CaiB-like acyl-CoA transferase
MPSVDSTAPNGAANAPLTGLRVIDCSTVLAGPYCTMVLGDLGADVIKVEPPEGDATRGWGPPWVGSAATGTRTAAYYLAVNRNRRSIRLDLKTEGGREVLRRLLAVADVLVENARVGGFAALGFPDEELQRLNPDLVHLAITGYGLDGPDAAKPGYDFVIQAVSGLMSVTGFPSDEGGHPTKVGVAISDIATGLFGAISVLAGLLARNSERRQEGARGQRVDVSLLGSTLALLINQAQNAFVSGQAPIRRGNAHPNIIPYETFGTADGEVAVGVGSERQWRRLCDVIGAPELATDTRFATNGDRVTNRDELRPLLAKRLAAGPTEAWLDRLDRAGIPAGPILDVPAAFASTGARARHMRVPMLHPLLGAVDQVGLPFEFVRTPASIRTPPPLLGEQTDEILIEAGYSAEEIGDLRAAGVV